MARFKSSVILELLGIRIIAVTPDGIIHCFYEGGSISGTGGNQYKNTHMSVVSFDLKWLTNGDDHPDKKDKRLNDFIRK